MLPFLHLVDDIVTPGHHLPGNFSKFTGMLTGICLPSRMNRCTYQDHLRVQTHHIPFPKFHGPLQCRLKIGIQSIIDGLLHHLRSFHSLERIQHAQAVFGEQPVNSVNAVQNRSLCVLSSPVILRFSENRAGADHFQRIHRIDPVGNAVHEIPFP